MAASAPGSPTGAPSSPLAKSGLLKHSPLSAKADAATPWSTQPGGTWRTQGGGNKKKMPQFHRTQFYTKPFDIAYEELAKARNLRKLEQLFFEADTDGSGEMSLDEFREALRMPRIQRAFSVLGVQPHQSEPIFQFLNKRHHEEISITDFMTGLTELVGTDIDGTGKELDIETLRPSYKSKVKYHSHYQSGNVFRPAALPRSSETKSSSSLDLGPVHLLPKAKVQRAFVHSASAQALHPATAMRK